MRQYLKDENIDLCYIDPPFNSKRNYNQIYMNIGHEDTAQVQAFVDTWTWSNRSNKEIDELFNNEKGLYTTQTIRLIDALEKVLTKGSKLSYLISMTLRIAEIYKVLKKNGSFYLQCDPTASHHIKLVCDSIFCPKGGDFKNEIIWCYGGYIHNKNSYNKKHDVILFYSKSDEWTFNAYEILDELSVNAKNKYKHKDSKGLY
jgi:site-specific DNA-methyltransferase (adenine-specific)